jgi:general stress protein 26
MSTKEQYEKIASYIDNNPVAILGTIDENGGPYGAAVYLCADPHHPKAYLLTKNETRKFKNLSQRNKVSLTIANQKENSTLQATGRASVTHDSEILDMVLKKMVRANPFASEWVPPVSKLEAGQYAVVQIDLEYARLAEFNADGPGSDHIFTEI